MEGFPVSDLPTAGLVFAVICAIGAMLVWRYADADRSIRIEARYGKPWRIWSPIVLIAISFAQALIRHERIWVVFLGIGGILGICFTLFEQRRDSVES